MWIVLAAVAELILLALLFKAKTNNDFPALRRWEDEEQMAAIGFASTEPARSRQNT